MKRIKLALIATAFTLTGCSSMPERTCSATYESGGGEHEVYIFGTMIQGDKLYLRAGYPFSFHYVSERNFKDHNCGG
ncbi:MULTISPECIES: phage exclusion lipoprotein Cor [Gammaproteobacteria]|uniref:phage exclusion lipoprotein Cor n=1 Tax=Gammaproteobacteria TaxID=1236 RepID=UPI002FC9FC84